MGSILKPHVFKFCLLIVMMLLGFNACILYNGWPRPRLKYVDVITAKETYVLSLRSFGQPSHTCSTAIIPSTTLAASIDHISATNLSKMFIPSKNVTPPTATSSTTRKPKTKTAVSASVPPIKNKLNSSRHSKDNDKKHVQIQEYYRQLTEDKFRKQSHKQSSPNHLVDSGVVKKVLRPPRKRCSCRYICVQDASVLQFYPARHTRAYEVD